MTQQDEGTLDQIGTGPPEWLQDLARRYRNKPTPQELTDGMNRAKQEGFSQRQLASIMGTWQQTINRWQRQ